ncbi:50S ribosomal protein L33 [Candidatus Babeliales bacterium]|nr:50S ribosomal protein L33 [Candidatus Babeliales bacterium]MCF7899346.1 50S ribosomal protein L33 [Candidatus Babeliales bacterium]
MAKARTIIHLECKGCKSRNYSKQVSKKRQFGKLNLSKYCSKCRKHLEHKETK